MTLACARVATALDEGLAEHVWPEELAAHATSCVECQARMALARRIEHALATWPTAAPPPGFAARMAATARHEAWAQEVVVDWGFNLAVAACMAVILFGVAGGLWMMSSAVPTAESSQVAADLLTAVAARARAQASIAVTAMALLATAVGGWWWAEQQQSE